LLVIENVRVMSFLRQFLLDYAPISVKLKLLNPSTSLLCQISCRSVDIWENGG